MPSMPAWHELFDVNAVLIFTGWMLMQLLLSLLPIGSLCSGLPLKSGKPLQYRCNGFQAFVISLSVVSLLVFVGVPVHYVYHRFLALATTSILFSFLFAFYLYARSFWAKEEELAEGGNTGHVIYDFFVGRELNPRIGNVDLKFFCELRPGLIGWIVLDLVFILELISREQTPPPSLLLITAFHTLYVADALWHEEAILTTMDIVHDGFGLMLAFGDLAWVPFLYCLQARFILEHPPAWSALLLTATFLLNYVGFLLFRASNSQKNAFRLNPSYAQEKNLKTLMTKSGRKLLISGWWGFLRHPNYLGDLIMAFSWSFVTGFDHLLPYFYPIYFTGLLVHRSQRDDSNCREKYGPDWMKYCSIVPYRILPGVY